MSVKQGIKYDAPDSAKDIPAFIEFHKLDVNEILDPLDSFKNFNEFFYRCVSSAFLTHPAFILSFRRFPVNSNPQLDPLRTPTTQTDSFLVQTVE